jgi:hypothetical protein
VRLVARYDDDFGPARLGQGTGPTVAEHQHPPGYPALNPGMGYRAAPWSPRAEDHMSRANVMYEDVM